jgi:hypothetical protein
MVGFCSGRYISMCYSITDDFIPGDKGSDSKPGEQFEDGMKKMNGQW